jgi:glycosyltransferase 2 family protein
MSSLLHRRLVRAALLAGSTAGALALFLTQARPGRLASSLGSLPLGAVLTAAAATMAGVMLGAVRWRTLLAAGGVEAPAPKLFAALTIGSAVNNLVPARGGDAVRVESARQLTGASPLAIVGTMVSERVLDGFVLALLVLIGALLAGLGGAFIWVGAGLAGALALAAPLIGRLLRGRFAAGLAVFRMPNAAAPALAATVGIWFADVVMYAALARGFDLDVSFAGILLLVGVGNLALAIPGLAAGLGSFELVTLAGAHGIGIGGPALAAFVLAVHAVIVLPPTITGLVLARVALPRTFRLRAAN